MSILVHRTRTLDPTQRNTQPCVANKPSAELGKAELDAASVI